MYLFVFVFLVIGLIGIYAQVFALQTARLFSNQTGAAQLMLTWHAGAVSLAKNIVSPPPAVSCSLSFTVAAPAYCTTVIPPNPANVTMTNGGSPPIVNQYVDAAAKPYPHMPQGYSTGYLWRSVYFRNAANNQYYVVTWAPPPASGRASDPIDTPAIGITGSELLQQFRNARLPLMGYGTVSGGQLITSAALVGGPVQYAVPAAVANGSIAVISSP